MSKQSEEFFRVMLEFLPSTKNKYRDSIEEYGLLLETVVIEDIFMPDIIKLISENKDIKFDVVNNVNFIKQISDTPSVVTHNIDGFVNRCY